MVYQTDDLIGPLLAITYFRAVTQGQAGRELRIESGGVRIEMYGVFSSKMYDVFSSKGC